MPISVGILQLVIFFRFKLKKLLHKRHYEKFADGTVKDIEDEIPFDVPEGWAWASLSEIANIYTGNSINENEKANKYSNLKEGLFYIATKDIDFEGKINYNNGIRIPLAESKFKIAPAESTLLCIEGGSAGRKIGFINQDVCFVNKLCCFHSDYLSNLYLYYYLQSRTFIDLFNSNKSGLIGGVSLNLLKSIFIPVAPAIEQDLISKTIATYLEKITSLNKDKETLEFTIKKAKSKILDLAIHGKLVPQDANDEPASVLLEKLRAEKEEKIAKGELKRDKNDSYIYKGSDNCYYEKFNGKEAVCIDEEIPFDISEGWAWCRLGSYLDVRDGTHDSPKYVEKGYPFVTSKNLVDGKIDFSSVKYISEKDHNDFIKRSLVEDGDILFAMIGSIGNPVLVKKDREFSIKNVALFKPYNKENTFMEYVLYFLIFIQESLRVQAKGGMQPFIPLSFFRKDLLIPLPPISEQKRIVSKVEEIFERLDQIQSNLI